jgi:hypothetical protein
MDEGDKDEGDNENGYEEDEDRSPGHSAVDDLDDDDGGEDDGAEDESEQAEQTEADDESKRPKRKRNLPCTKCGRLYSSENSLRNHIRIKHTFKNSARTRASSTDGCVPIRAKNTPPATVTPVLGTPLSGTPTPTHIVSMQTLASPMEMGGAHTLLNGPPSQELATIPIPNLSYAHVGVPTTIMAPVGQVSFFCVLVGFA